MNDDDIIEDAERVFTKTKPMPRSYAEEQARIHQNYLRLKRERLAREAAIKVH
jgi:hypothetical protein